jgi:hypothetical protein
MACGGRLNRNVIQSRGVLGAVITPSTIAKISRFLSANHWSKTNGLRRLLASLKIKRCRGRGSGTETLSG